MMHHHRRKAVCKRARPSLAMRLVLLWSLLFAGLPAFAVLPFAVDGAALPSLAPMLERVTPAVVNIATVGSEEIQGGNPLMNDPFFKRFFNVPNRRQRRKTQSLGSGVIIDARRGYVVTNHHVIDKASEITVTLRDGRSLAAVLIGTDPDTDVAVIKVPAKGLKALKFANSDRLRVGDFVVAIGNPFGLGQTVTSGIVSALGRSGLGIEGYEDFIQTDASINVGNSGGALVNLRGELVGINTAILAPNGGNVGVGFAIPVNMAADIMDQLLTHGRVRRGLLGLVAQDLTEDLAEAFGLSQANGAVVVRVLEGSAAAQAGLREGDVLHSVNGRVVRNAGDMRTIVGLSRVGQVLQLQVLREGKPTAVRVVIPEPDTARVGGEDLHAQLAGVTFGNIESRHPLFGRTEGAQILELERNSPGRRLGLRAGDVIIGVNGIRLNSVANLEKLARARADGLTFDLIRGTTRRRLLLP
jgi:Do/DeqQ family serine protease